MAGLKGCLTKQILFLTEIYFNSHEIRKTFYTEMLVKQKVRNLQLYKQSEFFPF